MTTAGDGNRPTLGTGGSYGAGALTGIQQLDNRSWMNVYRRVPALTNLFVPGRVGQQDFAPHGAEGRVERRLRAGNARVRVMAISPYHALSVMAIP
ncbi:hypothetical protein E7T06_05015 [Deinococcus sp. Arct2-2]|uniref:hypothetical protein n=1 Tax=Deinococcus sp. Arct2-2 TaxID=2568653 RepID=UPI0010A40DE4|nr:hypothetical protein [Deinococcus sp. Arct2-2]THF70923.1 hypothetical protein E7T06_05015 [Deinococcus sp. Arct2-2]